jgi:hypothetical protein
MTLMGSLWWAFDMKADVVPAGPRVDSDGVSGASCFAAAPVVPVLSSSVIPFQNLRNLRDLRTIRSA